jgi:CheY-like chemotaxis protein
MGHEQRDDNEKDVRSLVEERLAEADELAAAGTALEALVHGLNNPLAALMLDLEQLCEQIVYVMPSAERAEASRTVADARAEAVRLAEGVRELARLVPRDAPRRVELHDLLLSVLHLVERQYGGRVLIHRRLGAEGLVVTRPARLTHLVRGLVQRVVQSSRGYGPTGSVDVVVGASRADGYVSIQVGPRSRGSITRPSLPLGSIRPPALSIPPAALEVPRDPVLTGIAEQLGATLHVDAGNYLLVLPVELPAVDAEPAAARKRPSAPELGEIRMLVVDDEPSIQRSLGRALRDVGLVQAVSSVKSAIDLLAGGAVFDVVLCDLVMPESSGIELLAWLAEYRPRLRRRSILMSGMQAAQADMHPDVPVVQKPFDLRALRTLVCEVAQRA